VYLNNVTNGDILYTNFTGGPIGIYLDQSEFCILTCNRIENCSRIGVRVERSTHCTVRNSTINDCDIGISLDSSPRSTVLYNQIRNTKQTGIFAYFSFYCEAIGNIITLGDGDAFEIHFSNHSEFIENIVCFNGGIGVWVSNGRYILANNTAYANARGGVLLENCLDCCLTGNRLHTNNWNGLSLISSENSSIRENLLYANIGFGLLLDEASDFSQIYDNQFGWNIRNNSRDEGPNNDWDNGVDTGNAWSDYIGGGLYEIPGTANATDRHPTHLIDTTPPEITPHRDIEYTYGTQGNVLVYTPIEQFPHRFSVYKNGTTFQLGYPWDMHPIRINVDHLQPGRHEFEVMIYDAQGNRAYDQVMVLVQPGTERTAPLHTIIVRMGISAFLVGLALLLVEFGRRWSKDKGIQVEQ
jgi:parallel beta-helix repeat protein